MVNGQCVVVAVLDSGAVPPNPIGLAKRIAELVLLGQGVLLRSRIEGQGVEDSLGGSKAPVDISVERVLEVISPLDREVAARGDGAVDGVAMGPVVAELTLAGGFTVMVERKAYRQASSCRPSNQGNTCQLVAIDRVQVSHRSFPGIGPARVGLGHGIIGLNTTGKW